MDRGIGMTREHLAQYLGVIGYSGTREWKRRIDPNDKFTLYASFGVGFYRVFDVANRVQVITRADDDEQYMWESWGGESYTIRPYNDKTLDLGTKVILHMKEAAKKLLTPSQIKAVVTNFIEYPKYPIKLYADARFEPDPNASTEESILNPFKFVLKKANTPLWLRDPGIIKEEDFKQLYRKLTSDAQDYLFKKYIVNDKFPRYRALFYIPRRPLAHDKATQARPHNIKVYSNGIRVSDENTTIIPPYLNFIYGIAESLNFTPDMSREDLVPDLAFLDIGQLMAGRCCEMLEQICDDPVKFNEFYKQYWKNIKLGVCEDPPQLYRLSRLLRYYTSKSGADMVFLHDYVDRMKKNQDCIYYITGRSIEGLRESVFIERLLQLDLEVIYMTDPIDEFVLETLTTFGSYKLVDVSSVELTFPGGMAQHSTQIDVEFQPLCDFIFDTLSETLQGVMTSNRLVSSPCCITKAESPCSTVRGQRFLEINPRNEIIKHLNDLLSKDQKWTSFCRDVVTVLYDAALLEAGDELKHSEKACELILRYLNKSEGEDKKAEDTVTIAPDGIAAD